MGKIRLIFVLFLFILISASCSSNNECGKFKGLEFTDLESMIMKANRAEQAHELYLYGECKLIISKPILKHFEKSKIINHHALHKGMSLGYIASISLKKIQ
jgi:Fe2+ or Zn2+ uptake regulation protein